MSLAQCLHKGNIEYKDSITDSSCQFLATSCTKNLASQTSQHGLNIKISGLPSAYSFESPIDPLISFEGRRILTHQN